MPPTEWVAFTVRGFSRGKTTVSKGKTTVSRGKTTVSRGKTTVDFPVYVGRIKLRYVNLSNTYEVTQVQFVEAIGCEMVHFLEFNRRRDLWEFFCYGPRGRMNTCLFLSKLTGIARRGILKELEVCDFEKNWSACQYGDGSCCEKFSEFFMVTFSYNQTKR